MGPLQASLTWAHCKQVGPLQASVCTSVTLSTLVTPADSLTQILRASLARLSPRPHAKPHPTCLLTQGLREVPPKSSGAAENKVLPNDGAISKKTPLGFLDPTRKAGSLNAY